MQKPYKLRDDQPKCDECTQAKQGCFWDGISRTGLRRRADAKKAAPMRAKFARKKDEVVDVDSDHGDGTWSRIFGARSELKRFR